MTPLLLVIPSPERLVGFWDFRKSTVSPHTIHLAEVPIHEAPMDLFDHHFSFETATTSSVVSCFVLSPKTVCAWWHLRLLNHQLTNKGNFLSHTRFKFTSPWAPDKSITVINVNQGTWTIELFSSARNLNGNRTTEVMWFLYQISNTDRIPLLCQITLMDVLVSAKFRHCSVTFLVSGVFEWGGNDLDVLPHVYLFLRGGNFTSWTRNNYVYYFVKLWIYPFLSNCWYKYQSLSNSFIHSSFSTLTGAVNEFTWFNKF